MKLLESIPETMIFIVARVYPVCLILAMIGVLTRTHLTRTIVGVLVPDYAYRSILRGGIIPLKS